MKLIIQIPCYNEEKTLVDVLKTIPKKIPGITQIERQIIDDGSTDKTIEVAKKYKVTHIVKHTGNKWLGYAFKSWVENALAEGADILVNTDWDNQYPSKYISDLIQPLLAWEADMVMWDRQTATIEHFSPLKKFFQWFGSSVVRYFSGTSVPDSVSWFRAYSRDCLLRLNVTSQFSYAVDTIVQAGNKKLKVASIKIETNKPTRPSRLFKNMYHHMYKTGQILLRVYTMYNPMRLFFTLGYPFLFLGSIGILRFLYFYFINPVDTGKVQSLILSWVFLIIAVQFFALGIIGDLIAKNRKLIEDDLYFTKKRYFEKK